MYTETERTSNNIIIQQNNRKKIIWKKNKKLEKKKILFQWQNAVFYWLVCEWCTHCCYSMYTCIHINTTTTLNIRNMRFGTKWYGSTLRKPFWAVCFYFSSRKWLVGCMINIHYHLHPKILRRLERSANVLVLCMCVCLCHFLLLLLCVRTICDWAL